MSVTDSQRLKWNHLFVLLNTTNYYAHLPTRKGDATEGNISELRMTYIQRGQDVSGEWVSHRLPIATLLSLILDECTVGRNGTTLVDCVNAIHEVAVKHGLPDLTVQLHKVAETAYLSVIGLNGKQRRMVEDLRANGKMRESEVLVEEVGPDGLALSWIILLKRQA